MPPSEPRMKISRGTAGRSNSQSRNATATMTPTAQATTIPTPNATLSVFTFRRTACNELIRVVGGIVAPGLVSCQWSVVSGQWSVVEATTDNGPLTTDQRL